MIDINTDDIEPNLEEFDKNLPHTVTLLRTVDGARVYVVGTGHFSLESQNDVSLVNYYNYYIYLYFVNVNLKIY